MLSEKANLPGRAYKSGNVRSSSLLESRTTLEASVRGIRESCYWQWPCQDNHGLLVTFLLSRVSKQESRRPIKQQPICS